MQYFYFYFWSKHLHNVQIIMFNMMKPKSEPPQWCFQQVFSVFVQLMPHFPEAVNAAPFYKADCLKVICFPWVGLTGLDSRGSRPQTPQGGVEKENIRAKMKLSNSLARFPKIQEINTCKESCVKESRVYTVGHFVTRFVWAHFKIQLKITFSWIDSL